MTNLLGSIRLAGYAFSLIAALVAVPLFCRQVRARCFNWVRTVFGGLFLFYVLCVLALVFFPLPDAAQAAKLTTYDAQLVPFQFVADFLRETPLVRSDARTYLPALFDRTVQQVVCNILMLMPFGMYLRYVCGLDLGRVALVSLAFSAFIELGQLTGLFFLFRGSYRLCDVDDLMLNTLGGLLGGELVRALDGQAVFYSHYTNEAFLSRAAMPVMSGGKTVGAVYVCESDSERAALIGSIQRRLATITIGIGAAALVIVLLAVWFWLRRNDCSDRALVLAAALLAVAIPFFLPHMHDRYFFAADALTLALAAAWPQLALPALLCEFASLLGYHAYLRMRYLLPMADGALALIAALIILAAALALELRQSAPLNDKMKKST